jgi:hypothetical protein
MQAKLTICENRTRQNSAIMHVLVGIVAGTLLLSSDSRAQSPAKSISEVYAQGKTSGQEYRNDYFGLTLTVDGGQFTSRSFLSSEGKRARLVDAEANAKNWDEKYSIAVLADGRSENTLIQTPSQYVRAVRHQFEKEGMQTVREEFSVEISGLPFAGAVMKVKEQDRVHFRGMYATFLNGYILSLDVAAGSPERLDQVVQKTVRFKAENKGPAKK